MELDCFVGACYSTNTFPSLSSVTSAIYSARTSITNNSTLPTSILPVPLPRPSSSFTNGIGTPEPPSPHSVTVTVAWPVPEPMATALSGSDRTSLNTTLMPTSVAESALITSDTSSVPSTAATGASTPDAVSVTTTLAQSGTLPSQIPRSGRPAGGAIPIAVVLGIVCTFAALLATLCMLRRRRRVGRDISRLRPADTCIWPRRPWLVHAKSVTALEVSPSSFLGADSGTAEQPIENSGDEESSHGQDERTSSHANRVVIPWDGLEEPTHTPEKDLPLSDPSLRPRWQAAYGEPPQPPSVQLLPDLEASFAPSTEIPDSVTVTLPVGLARDIMALVAGMGRGGVGFADGSGVGEDTEPLPEYEPSSIGLGAGLRTFP